MAKTMEEWLKTDVQPFREKSISWISQHHFFRDPSRPTYADRKRFFSPADGIIIYQREVNPDEAIVMIKGKNYTLRDALRDKEFSSRCLVIGIFMTFFDVHVNRIPYPGLLSYKELDAIDTFNHPMLEVETGIFEDLRIPVESLGYLHHNQRMVNRVFSSELGLAYYILQIADYDVNCVTPFELKQNKAVGQGERFSMVRYGSQVDLIVPLSPRFEYKLLQERGTHVEAGLDPLIELVGKTNQ